MERYRINRPHVISETVGPEAVIIHQGTGAYYSLEGSGAAIWAGLEAAAPVGEIVGFVMSRHDDAEPEEVQAAVQRLIEELRSEDLVADAGDSDYKRLALPDTPDLGSFQAPTLRKFTDMQDLILIDPVHEVDARGWPHVDPSARA